MTFVSARDDGLGGEASILWVIGELDDLNVAAFEAELERLVSTTRSLIVELSSCSFMSSCALNVLVRFRRHRPELTIGLVTSSAHFAKLLGIAGLEPLLPRFENVVDALVGVGEPNASGRSTVAPSSRGCR